MRFRISMASVAIPLACIAVSGCETLERTGFLVAQGPGNGPDSGLRKPAPMPIPAELAVPAPRQVPAVVATAPGTAPPLLNAYTQWSKYGDLIFISGQIPLDLRSNTLYGDASIEEQTRVVMQNLKVILEVNHLTMANLVSTTVYLKDVNTLREMNPVYESYFKGNLPARTVVEVNKLPRGVALQISAIAGK
jgi:2-iminobutanoate/2-iminopropanoate deaminase